MENHKPWLIALSALLALSIIGGLVAILYLAQQNNLLQQQLSIAKQEQSAVVSDLSSRVEGLKSSAVTAESEIQVADETKLVAVKSSTQSSPVTVPVTPIIQNEVLKTLTYKTDAYGFQVQYPSSWITANSGDTNGGYVNFIPSNKNGVDTCLVLFGYPGMTVAQAEKVLPVLSVAGRAISSRTKVTINGIVWNKLVIDGQVVLLTAKNSNTYGAQYSTSETKCNQVLSSYIITN